MIAPGLISSSDTFRLIITSGSAVAWEFLCWIDRDWVRLRVVRPLKTPLCKIKTGESQCDSDTARGE